MDTPNIHQIQTMPKEELAALNKRLTNRFAAHMLGMLFLKLAVPSVAGVLVRKAVIQAAKKA